MRLRIQHPLFAGFLGIIGLSVILIVFLVGAGLRRELQADMRAELDRLLALGETIFASSPTSDPHDLVRLIRDATGYGVTLLASDGRVVADASVEPSRVPEMPSQATRPEIRALLEGGERRSFFLPPDRGERGADGLFHGTRLTTLAGAAVILRISAPQVEIEASVGRIQRRIAIAGILAMLLALLAAYGLSASFARPLVELSDRARRLADGDFAGPVPYTRVAELQDLGVAFNRLTEELRNRLSELSRERDGMQALIDCMAEGVIALTEDGRIERTNRAARALLDVPELPAYAPVGTVVRHPELREALKESVVRPEQSREIALRGRHLLLASRALDHGGAVTTLLDITEIRRMERVRSDFVANASHELKTPLTSIRGYAEALADGPPEHMRKQFLSSILSNTLRLQRLVDDLLDLSRLESGSWSANLEVVRVGDVVEEAWEMVAPHAPHPVEFSTRGEAAVLGDRQGLVQVFRNLFDNAARHTPAGGHISVTVGRHRDRPGIVIAVADDGEGIPAQALPRIFERFYRADSSRARHVGGTGLGLAIVKHLVTAMRGDVWAESELGRGTTVWIRLPEGEGAGM
jgi:two-component system phosphate regulon sensor histidine kinase PhoR